MRRATCVLALVAACSTPDDSPPGVEAFVPKLAVRPHRDVQVTPPTQPQPPPPPPPRVPPTIPSTCVKPGTVTAMATRGASFVACLDVDSDATPDQCVEWNRASGRVVKIMPVADLEDGPPQPVTDDKVDDNDDRISQETNTIQVCPEDRLCVKLMPRVGDNGSLDSVHGDANHHNLAVAISDGDGENAHLEFWDIQSGRMRSRIKITGDSTTDTSYTFTAKQYGDGLVSVATRGDNQMSTATLYGFDGTRRAALAGGSKFVDIDQTLVMSPGVIAVLDNQPPGRPYLVYLHSTSGATLGRFTIHYDEDNGDTATLIKIDNTSLGVIQHQATLQIDVLDTRTGGSRTFKAPGC